MKTSNLFPLDRVYPGLRRGCYFVDKEYDVYSVIHPTAVRTGVPVKLSGGFSQAYGRCYKLQTNTTWSPHEIIIASKMRATLAKDEDFRRFLTTSSVQERLAQAPVEPEGRFMIGSQNGNGYSFSSSPVVHFTMEAARKEAQRLALANPGKTFVIVQVMNTVVAGGVVWK